MQLINENVNKDDAVVYADGSVQRRDRSGRGFSGRISSKVVGEYSAAYRFTASSKRMGYAAKL